MFNVIGASVRGTRHCQTNTPCQDAHAWRIVGDRALIAAVADGVGSATHAQKGAQLAVTVALEVLKNAFGAGPPIHADGWTEAIKQAFTKAREGLEEKAKENALPLPEFATTLITVAITTDSLCIGHIGDGAVVAQLTGGAIETVSSPQKGMFVNEVIPLTSFDYLSHARFLSLGIGGEFVTLALLTDGLERLCLNTTTAEPFAPFFVPLFEGITNSLNTTEASGELADFLASERVTQRTDDDKTLLLIGKVPSASRSSEEEAKPALSAKSEATATAL